MEKIIRVNLSTKEIKTEEVLPEYKYLGGRSLTSCLINKEVPPQINPLSSENKLVFAPGLLGGMTASSVNRLSVGGKSPLTGGIKESNSGGNVALKMARLGIKAIIIEGKALPDELIVVKIDGKGEYLDEGNSYKNLKASETASKLKKKYGNNIAFSLVGPAGERGLLASCIVNSDKDGFAARFSARGGLGAVMGTKGLKALVFDDEETTYVQPKDKKSYNNNVKLYTKALRETPQTSVIYTKYGTTAMVDITNEIGGMPTKNFSTGSFKDAGKINGKALYDRICKRGGNPSHACMPGCIIKSSNIYPDKNGNEILRSFEYETIILCGSNLCISELDDIAELNVMINEHGLDSIDIGAALGVAMEAGIIPFGDFIKAKELLIEIENNTPVGRMIGSGAGITAKVLGVDRVPVVKNQAMAGYDPRAIKGHGVTFATSPMGADHTAGMTIREGLDPKSSEGQVEASRYMQMIACLYDSLGFCLFVHVAVRNNMDIIANLVNARFNCNYTIDDLYQMVKDTLRLEVEYNRQAGLGVNTDKLPDVFYQEILPSSKTVFDVDEKSMSEITNWK